jgi:adenylate cyclase
MVIRLGELLLEQWHARKRKPEPSWKLVGLFSLLVTSCLFLLNELGSFQFLELAILDRYFQLRPSEGNDPRLLIVTIDEPDISQLQQWPLSDEKLLQALEEINQHEPRVIALDIYRNFPIPPGEDALISFFQSTPHLIGVEKIGGTPVPPSPTLAASGQVALADLVLDYDGTVRRALLTTRHQGKPKWTLGAAAALAYLKQAGIEIDASQPTELTLTNGVRYPRLRPSDGGYSQVDARAYQILLNYRGPDDSFETVSIQEVLAGQVSADLIRDRIVMIGSIAPSLNDFVYSPYRRSVVTGTSQSPGVLVHAHIASQMMSTALDGRPLIRSWSTTAEWLWVYLWCALGSGLILLTRWPNHNSFTAFMIIILPVLGLGTGVLLINGLFFIYGWWVPSVPALLGILLSATISLTSSNLKLIEDAYTDGLTEVLNRRAFNQQILTAQKHPKAISIILCDIDYFKGYNDVYGHPAGDDCLKQVAKMIQQAVRSQDQVARYGGEEFAVVLQNTSGQKACEIAERMRQKVQSRQIPHTASEVSSYVSISCGVATRSANSSTPLAEVLLQADKALYESKRAGRNRVTQFQASNKTP